MSIRKQILLAFSLAVLIFSRASANVTVTIQPTNPVSLVGINITLTAQTFTTSGEVITGYTWKTSTNNQPPFNTISGATGSSLTLTNTQLSSAGYYFASVTYSSGATNGLTAVSTVAQLIVEDQARITSPPQPLIRSTGQSATFSVSALGQQPLSFQWRDNGIKLSNGGRISGATGSSLTISSLITNDTGNYDVIVSNTFASVTSQVAALTVFAPPFIVTPPTNVVVVTGNNAVFSFTPGGTLPLTFQWKDNGTPLFDGGRISGSSTSTLTISNTVTNDNGNYSVFFFNSAGSTSTVPVSLTVLVPPTITSPANASGQQGFPFSYGVTATGTTPMTFGVDSLPTGLFINLTNGTISGTPLVFGIFDVTLFVTNAAAVASTNLEITLASDVPGITSSLSVLAQQGQVFTYSITASNNPTSFTATGLPPGLTFNAAQGLITGDPLYSSTYTATISASNQFGGDTEQLTLTLSTGLPVITSPTTATGTENRTNFVYTITALNSPTVFGATGLPLGLVINASSGLITGTPVVGGTNLVQVSAQNAYGIWTTNVNFRIAYEKVPSLAITSVTYTYTNPYLLDFTFSLNDGSNDIVRPPEQLQVQCFEGDPVAQVANPIPNETAFVVNSALQSKFLKTFFVMDYSFSMFITPGAISNMQSSIEGLIDEEPGTAQFGVVEFSADYIPPIQVTGFTADKTLLTQDIEGIQSNYVQGNYAGTRFYDALALALTNNFTNANPSEEHFLVVLSDGYDDSSLLTTNANAGTLPDVIVNMATNNGANVRIYCVGFGPNPNTNVLQYLAAQTGGNYYAATTPTALEIEFGQLFRDISAQYTLRWATLQRSSTPFQPMFTVTLGGQSASFNTSFTPPMQTVINTNVNPPTTNTVAIYPVPLYTPSQYAGNVQTGQLMLVPDAASNISTITLHSFYTPRYVREIIAHYRANYPCTVSLMNTNLTNDILSGWSMTQTNDGAGGQLLTFTSADTNNILTSIPYGVEGDLAQFQFHYQAVPVSTDAFSFFVVSNSIYSNMIPGGQSFTLTNTNAFVTNLPILPPMGTPVLWLQSYGFTNASNYAAIELSDPNGNGLAVWQDYLAGLNPTNPASKFVLSPIQAPQISGQPPQVTFPTVFGRTYRVDSSVDLINWVTLDANIAGTGGMVTIPDNRNLSGANAIFYRVALSY